MLCKNCHEVLGSWIEKSQSTSGGHDRIDGKIKLTAEGAREGCFICVRKISAERHRQISLLMRPQPIAAHETDLNNIMEILEDLNNEEELLKIPSSYDAIFSTNHLASTTVHLLRIDRTPIDLEITKCEAGYADRCEEAQQSASTGSEASLNLAKFWLRTCLNDHELCEKQQRTKWYPTRLLRVETSTVRLIHTAVERPSQPYTTLSYCWGGASWENLSDVNMAKFETGVSISTFPALFQDVFRTVKALGFLYVWIDSFCIVQNSSSDTLAQDKLREMSQMALVYSNSTLNIGATQADNPYRACFRPCETNEILPQFARFGKCRNEAVVYHVDDGDKDFNFWYLPLFTRAWIFQERLLCPRMLHFEPTRISWECNQLLICNGKAPISRIDNPRDHPKCYQHGSFPAFSLQNSHQIHTHEPLEIKPNSWRQIVRTYSGLHLSKPQEDKFTALAGLARHYAELVEDKYIAGFFHKDLPVDLCWYREDKPTEEQILPGKKRAPTWSWASIDHGVEFFSASEYSGSTFVEIERPEIQPLNPGDLFGAIVSATIYLLGTPLRVQLSSCMDRPSVSKTLAVGTMSLMTLERDPNAPTAVCRVEEYFDDFWDPVWRSSYIILPIYIPWLLPHDPFYGQRYKPDNFDNRMDYYLTEGLYHTIQGLILKKNREGTYRRLGMCVLKPLSLRDIPDGFKAPANRILYSDLIESSPKTSVALV